MVWNFGRKLLIAKIFTEQYFREMERRKEMKLTRNCLEPWRFSLIYAGGKVSPCCVMNDTDYGDFLLDYEEGCDIFNNEKIVSLRKGLLTGNLRQMCQGCFLAPSEYITTDELQEKVKNYLAGRAHYNVSVPLELQHACERVGFGLSNKCNLHCIYCNQSCDNKADKPFYFKDFPEDRIAEALDYLVREKVDIIETYVDGEPTLSPLWFPTYTKFHKEHPDIGLSMTTNLSRQYKEEEIELMTQYRQLYISCDTLDSQLFSQIRQGGSLSLLLENLKKIKMMIQEKNIDGPEIAINFVLCSVTWKSLKELAEFALENDYGLHIIDYDARLGSEGIQKGLLQEITELPLEEQKQIMDILLDIRNKFDAKGLFCVIGSGAIASSEKRVNRFYHRYRVYDGNEVYLQYEEQSNGGSQNVHLDIVYDEEHISHEGILVEKGKILEIQLSNIEEVYYRDLFVYDDVSVSKRYEQKVVLGYRRKTAVQDGKFVYEAKEANANRVLVEILGYK